MKQHVALHGLAVLALFGAVNLVSAAEAEQRLIHFGESNPGINLRYADKGQSAKKETIEEKSALRFEWDGTQAPFLEAWLAKPIKLPEFTSAQIKLQVYVAEGAPSSLVNIRLVDKDGETFQFGGKIPQDAKGWITLTYDLNADKPGAGAWGGKTQNKKLDFPVTFNGIAVDFRNKASGYVDLGLAELNIISAPKPADTEKSQNKDQGNDQPFQPLIDLGEKNPSFNMRYADKGQSVKKETIEDKSILRFEWDGTQAPFLEAWLDNPIKLPEFTSVKIRLQVYVPEGAPSSLVNIRLNDKDGETFQFGGKIPQDAKGWITLTYDLNADKLRAGIWGGKTQNKKLDFPVTFNGVAVDFRDKASGYVGLGLVELKILSAPIVATLETGTGSPVNVLKLGEESQLAIVINNPGSIPTTCELQYDIVRLESGESIVKNKSSIDIPAASQRRVALTAPLRLGVYRVDYELRENDKQTKSSSTRFAYIIPSGPTQEPSSGFIFGVSAHPQGSAPALQEREALAAALCGVKVVREDVSWENMERNPGQWNFERFDRTVNIFGQYGLEIAPIYTYVPAWAAAKDVTPPEELTQYYQKTKKRPGKPLPDFKHWENFVSTFANRYKDNIRYYEVWNEPDHPGFAYFSAANYVELMKIAHRATKKARPDSIIISGGLAGLGDGTYAEKVMTLGKGYYDIFAFHGHGSYEGYVPTINRLVELRKKVSDNTPWYANETAISSMSVGELVQAETLFRKFIFSWAMGAMGYNWYDLRNDGFDPQNNEHNFGMITKEFQPKLVYAAYANLSHQLYNGQYLRPLVQRESTESYLFTAANGDYVIPNWTNASYVGALTGITGSAEKVDLWGNVTPIAVESGMLVTSFSVQPSIIRIKGQKNEPRWENDVVKTPNDMVLRFGHSTKIPMTFNNPGLQPLKVEWTLQTPTGVKVKPENSTLILPPKSNQNIDLTFTTDPGYRAPMGDDSQATMKLKLGSQWQETLNYLVKTAFVISKEYLNTPDFVLEKASQNTSLVVNAPENKSLFWYGVDDLSAKIWLAQDGKSLRIKVVVKDDIHNQPFTGENVWNGDNIQFAIKLPGQKSLWEMGLTLRNDGKTETYVWIAPKGFDRQKVAAAINLTASRDENLKLTTYNASVPFEAIGLKESDGKNGFRFNMLVNDNDGSIREGFMVIAPGMGTNQESKSYSIIAFE